MLSGEFGVHQWLISFHESHSSTECDSFEDDPNFVCLAISPSVGIYCEKDAEERSNSFSDSEGRSKCDFASDTCSFPSLAMDTICLMLNISYSAMVESIYQITQFKPVHEHKCCLTIRLSAKTLHQLMSGCAPSEGPTRHVEDDASLAMRFILGMCPFGLNDPTIPFIIMIGGTSGSGKSSLALELQKRLSGWRKWQIISTDELRQEIRPQYPSSHLIWRSTYNITDHIYNGTDESGMKVIEGYRAQVSLVEEKLIQKLSNPLSGPLLVEGVHLTPSFCSNIASEIPSPSLAVFLLVSDDVEHKHRFELRGPKPSSPTLPDPSIGKYFHYFQNIKCISAHLTTEATQYGLLVVENSNLNDSVSLVLKSILPALRQRPPHRNLLHVFYK